MNKLRCHICHEKKPSADLIYTLDRPFCKRCRHLYYYEILILESERKLELHRLGKASRKGMLPVDRLKGESEGLMGTVRKMVSAKTGNISWQIDYLDPDGKRIRKNFKKQKDAKAHLTKYENDINNGDYVDPQKYRKATLKDLIENYEENFSYQAGYATSKKYLIEFIRGYFGENKLLFNIRYVDLETFRNRLKQTSTKH